MAPALFQGQHKEEIEVKKNLVAVCAHADDAELNAGGTMAKWAAEGGSVRIIMATNNCSGYLIPESGDESAKVRLPPAETAEVRRREQAAAAAMVDADVVELGYWQRHYWYGGKVMDVGYEAMPGYPGGLPRELCILIAANEQKDIKRLADILVESKPSVVLTQAPFDIDPEHHAVCALVWQAMADERLKGVPLRFWSPSSGSAGGFFDPNYDHVEDISHYFDTKVELCGCHASQMTAKRRGIVRKRAACWGAKIGCKYAEPFRSAHWDEIY